uniref:Uncharacterized protein n=1 Tax=Rhizophora mucronata TaxID=61149 RepID=A0A2P2PHD7_RHIMU
MSNSNPSLDSPSHPPLILHTEPRQPSGHGRRRLQFSDHHRYFLLQH